MDKYIKEYLLQYGKVQVNDFGLFEITYKSAEIHPVLHTVTVPGKYVVFSENMVADAAELSNFIASKEQITVEDADNRMSEWVKNVKDTINLKKEYLLPFGKFLINAMGKIEFISSLDADISPESFGLEEFKIFVKPTPKTQKPVEIKPVEPIQKPAETPKKSVEPPQKTVISLQEAENDILEKPQKSKRRRSGLLIFLFSILFIVLGLGIFCFIYPEIVKTYTEKLESFVFKGKQNQSTKEIEKKVPIVEDVVTEEIDSQVETTQSEQPQEDIIKEKEPKSEPIVKEEAIVQTGSYYVIIGSFRSEKNAQNFVNQKQNEYPNAVNLGKGQSSDLYLIGLGPYTTKEDAESKRKSGKTGWWVMKK